MSTDDLCDVCAGLARPGAWDDLLVHADATVAIAHLPPSSPAHSDAYPGHLMMVPRRHVESPSALTDAEASEVGICLARVTRALERVEGVEHVYVARLGDGWRHLHFHFLPRYADTPESVRGMAVRDYAGVEHLDRGGVAVLVTRLRALLP